MNTRRSLSTLVVALVALSACGGDAEQTEASTQTTTTTGPAATDPATTPPTTTPPTTNPPVTTLPPVTTMAATTTTAAPTATTAPAQEPLPVGFTITLPIGGSDGLTYSEVSVEDEVEGPTSISVDDHGGLFISDPLTNRVLAIRGSDQSFIDLAPLGINWLGDIIAGDDFLIVLDQSWGGPEVERVLRVSYTGQLLDEIVIPAEFGFEGGVQDLLDTGDDNRTVLRYLDPAAQAAEWDSASQSWSWLTSIEIGGFLVTHVGGDMQVGELLLTVDGSPPQLFWAHLRYLRRADDGRWIVVRWDGVSGVEWWSGAGQFLGAATKPPGAYVILSAEALAATADGRVFAMTTYEDSVVVTELLPQPERIITP